MCFLKNKCRLIMQLSIWDETHTLRLPGEPQSGNLLSVICHSFVNKFRLTACISILLPANFSEPEIEVQNITRISGINLTCSSKEGYPKPTKMYISITNSTNSTNEHSGDMQISQDNVTELFSVSISLSIPFPDGVYNVTALCVLETESMKISSRLHNIGKAASQNHLFHQELHANLLIQPSDVHCLLGNFPAGHQKGPKQKATATSV